MSDRVLRSHTKRARQNLMMATVQENVPGPGQNQEQGDTPDPVENMLTDQENVPGENEEQQVEPDQQNVPNEQLQSQDKIAFEIPGTGCVSLLTIQQIMMFQDKEREERRQREDKDREFEERKQREERAERIELERERIQIERDREARAHELKLRELELQKAQNERADKNDNSSVTSENGTAKFDRYTQKLNDGQDADAYFIAFENYATREGWEKSTWVRRISQCLLGKARQAQNSIMVQDYDYEQLKTTVLEAFQLTPEAYRLRFRNTVKSESESIKAYINKLNHNFECWVKYSGVQLDDAKSITHLIVREQILERVPGDLKRHLLDKGIMDITELAKESEMYASHRVGYWKKNKIPPNQGNNRAPSNQGSQRGTGNREYQRKYDQGQKFHRPQPYNRNGGNGIVRQGVYNRNQADRNNPNRPDQAGKPNFQGNPNPNRQGFGNGNRNKPVGPNQSNKMYKCQVARENQCNSRVLEQNDQQRLKSDERFTVDGLVEGKQVKIFRDSGCTQTAVNEKLVPDSCRLPGQYISVKGIGGVVSVPLAKVNIDSEIVSGKFTVALLEKLDHDVLLGRDLDSWDDWVNTKPMMVMTRAQKQKEEGVQGQAQLHTYMKDQEKVHNESQKTQDRTSKTDQNKTHISAQATISKAAKAQKVHAQSIIKKVKSDNLLDSDINRLIELQNSDVTLEVPRKSVVDQSKVKDHRSCYYRQNGILMRKWKSHPTKSPDQVEEQIVLPKQYRSQVLNIAHDKAGHMGVRKTLDRITRHFYWPYINKQVSEYCESCRECQFMGKSKQRQKQLLRPLEIMDIPFKRVGIDIAGPLPETEQGNKYVLLICDYATRYPEAVPLSDQKAHTVAQALITVFARVGLPREIIHDRGTNFMSHVVTDMCTKLGISKIPATPYHQQTNGLTERFIGTMKLMIKSLSEDERNNWDKQLPLFMFAYREVPCESTGYSPFHLLYGRQVRGPLSLIKDGFLEQTSDQKDIPAHLLEITANLTRWMADARQNKQTSQDKMKYHYDKNAQDRTYRVGEEVLVFLPEGAGKLDSKWQGPYKITQKIGEVDYEVHMPDKRKSKRVLHANLLKKWYNTQHTQEMAQCYCVTGVIHEIGSDGLCEEPVDDDLETQFLDENIGPTYTQTQTWKDASISESVSQIQNTEMSEILENHSKPFTDVPGRTKDISHKLKTSTESPNRLRAYRTPHSLRPKVKAEIDNMLKLGIIEPSTSAWASPIVVVAKPNGDIRLCTDYRALNKITEFDPYPIPRIDEILDEVAAAKYITTLDLTKGFYQVPLDSEAKAKSAFITPFGQYSYNVMPFGMMNASATFQRLVDTVLKDCSEYCRQYIDDVAIFSNTWEDHLKHVDTVLTKIEESGLTIKPSKCKIAYSEVTYLGHTVGNKQIKPMLDKVEAVRKFPTPVTKKNVRSFLGLSGYYRKFVPHYAQISEPLIELSKKKAPKLVVWTQNSEDSFQTLKEYLISEPILSTPDFTRPFFLQTDASNLGLGAVLSQLDSEYQEHPIVYLSRKLKSNEINYSVPEKECLAIVWAIGKLRYYLLGYKFTVMTDHLALKWLDKTRAANNRLMRWSLMLQQFTFDIQYRKGVTNTNADALSRWE